MAFPRTYGRYVLEDRLAMGGMAEIFRARTATAGFDKRVCIKRVLPHLVADDDFVTMFRDEARTAARLQHANVVQVFDFGEVEEDDGVTLFLAMELVEGLDLRKLADQSRKKNIPFTVGEVTQIGIDMCRGLHHAHTLRDEGGALLGVVHRDISPHNVLVSKQGEVKVADFGIAKAAARATHTSTGIVKGKVAYMSPEQAEGKDFDHRLDQWATGVVLWELLCGERLFRGDNDITILRKVLNVEVPAPTSLRDDIPAELEAIILQALSGEPELRFADMRHMELALSRFLFSGVIDPATAEVRTAYARITEGGAVDQPRRTNIMPVAAVTVSPPPTVIRRDEQQTHSTTDDESKMPAPAMSGPPSILLSASTAFSAAPGPSSSLSSDESQVFVSSTKLPVAPRGSPLSEAPPTLLIDDAVSLDAAAAAFDLQASRRQSPAANDTLELPSFAPPSSKPERSRSERAAPGHPFPGRSGQAPLTMVGDGDLAAAARDALASVSGVDGDSTIAEDDGTPATRTLVPAAELSVTKSAAIVRAAVNDDGDDDDDLVISGRRPTTGAIAGILGIGALIGLVVAFGDGGDIVVPVATPVVAVVPVAAITPPPAPAVETAPVDAAIEPAAPEVVPDVDVAAIAPSPAVADVMPVVPVVPVAPVAAPAAVPTNKPAPAPSASAATKPPKPAAVVRASAEGIAAGPPGSVYIDVPGGWATVTVGKKVYGETPLTISLPSGRHSVTLTSGDGAQKKTVGVTVIAGKKVQIKETF